MSLMLRSSFTIASCSSSEEDSVSLGHVHEPSWVLEGRTILLWLPWTMVIPSLGGTGLIVVPETRDRIRVSSSREGVERCDDVGDDGDFRFRSFGI